MWHGSQGGGERVGYRSPSRAASVTLTRRTGTGEQMIGTTLYGKVDDYAGQHQLTRFVHVGYVPLIPVGATWILRGYDGHKMALSARSVIAGYTRIWGPIASVMALMVLGGVGRWIAAGAFAAVTALTWTWRSTRSRREQRRSEVHVYAFGTRCDPLRMGIPLARQLHAALTERWAEFSGGATPEEVAQQGASSALQAVTAYGLLRLAARLAPPDQARLAREASERILDEIHEVDAAAFAGGPYRGARQLQLPEPPR
jgi:hypothetical protein